jgi:hypothetical protein
MEKLTGKTVCRDHMVSVVLTVDWFCLLVCDSSSTEWGLSFNVNTANLLGHAVVQLVEALRYKLEGRGLDSRWCLQNFSLT